MTARDHRSDLPLGTVLGEAYRLTRRIADGGMGTVFEAEQLRLGKRCAVKVMSPDLAASRDALARFHREVEITSRLNHPHIVQVMDFGSTPGGAPFLVMEYLDGEDLAQRLRRTDRLTPAATVHIVKQVASALAATHAGGIVHRDLKPGNIFLISLPGGSEADSDFVKVVDFGISKVKHAGPRLTRASVLMGTPQYMPPEQASGRIDAIDHRSDQWALAVIAWEMLAGRGPFWGRDVTALLYQIVHQDPLPNAARAAGLTPAVEQVLLRALSKRPRDRFGSITAFSRAFETAVVAPAPVPTLTDARPAAPTAPAPASTSPWRLGTIFGGRAAPLAPPPPPASDSSAARALWRPLTLAAGTFFKALRPAAPPPTPAPAPPVPLPLLKTLLGAVTPRRLRATVAANPAALATEPRPRPRWRRRWMVATVPVLAAVWLYPRGRAPDAPVRVDSERAAVAAAGPAPVHTLTASLPAGSARPLRPISASALEPMLTRFFCAVDIRHEGKLHRSANFGKIGCPSTSIRTPAEQAIARGFAEARSVLVHLSPEAAIAAQEIPGRKQRRQRYAEAMLADAEFRRVLMAYVGPALRERGLDCPDCAPAPAPPARTVTWNEIGPYVAAHVWPDQVVTPRTADGRPRGKPRYQFFTCAGSNGIDRLPSPDPRLVRTAFVAGFDADLGRLARPLFGKILREPAFLALTDDQAATEHLRRRMGQEVMADPALRREICQAIDARSAVLGVSCADEER